MIFLVQFHLLEHHPTVETYLLQMMEFQAIGAVKESEKVRQLQREKGTTKWSGALVLSGLFILKRSDIRTGRLPFK